MPPTPDIASQDFFEDVEFARLDLHDLSLTGKEFHGCAFRQLKLQENSFNQVRFSECIFEDCDLTGIHPQGMKAQQVRFQRCKMVGVEWSGLAPFPQLAFEECQLRYASFLSLDLTSTPFLKCEFREGSLVQVDLTGADFGGTELTGTRFEECQLRKADFSTAKGAFFDPAKNRVREAKISMESAALVSISLGMHVAGMEVKDPFAKFVRDSGARKRTRRH